jgi:hypothetical protein
MGEEVNNPPLRREDARATECLSLDAGGGGTESSQTVARLLDCRFILESPFFLAVLSSRVTRSLRLARNVVARGWLGVDQ